MTTKFMPVKSLPSLHTVPLARLSVESFQVVLEADDVAEKRFRMIFDPYQAVRVTTADCFIAPDDLSIIPRTVVEVMDSAWLVELRLNLGRIDATATFLNKARHFLVPLQDNFLEVVAWNVKFEEI